MSVPSAVLSSRSVVCVSLGVVVGLCSIPQSACAADLVPTLTEQRTYSNPAPVSGSFLVGAADLSDDYVGVLGGRSTGSRAYQYDAFIYDAVTGAHLRTLSQPVPADNVNFRFASIAIDGDLAVIGATFEHIRIPGRPIAYNAGAAYVYELSTGELLHRFVSDTPEKNDLLGSSVDIQGDSVVVGGWGTAYVFDARTGAQLAELIPSTTSDQFGISVSVSESAIVAGSSRDQNQDRVTGAVFTFDPQTYEQTSKFVPADWWSVKGLGLSVAVDGNVAIASDESASYVFDAHTGTEITRLRLPGSTTYVTEVDIENSIALLGNPALRTAMTFDWVSGTPIQQLVGGDVAGDRSFGFSVALSGEEALVTSSTNSYEFRIIPEPSTVVLVALSFVVGPALRKRRAVSWCPSCIRSASSCASVV